MESKDLISIADLNREDLTRILNRAADMKMASASPLKGRTLAMIFEKPSLRTKVSFDVAMNELGGYAIYISGEEIGLGKREPISDVAQVLSRYVDLIMARTFEHSTVESLAQHATVPVINGLSNREHPCQAIADLLTIQENKGVLEGLTVAYIGDGNNVAVSLLLACAMAGTSFKFAAPKGYELPDEIIETGQQIAAISKYQIVIDEDPQAVAEGADVIYTDVWTSMGQEAESEKRRRDFASYRITAELLAKAKPNALLMHPMPVHHGEEFAEGLIDCPQSVLLDQAENRLHAQKAILVELAKR
ncbi:MAG: ornithine carbamoyltransferase [Chloroflexota bacterium]|nr:ornithine carbamoyltransferase [Chloroflexota bacterium]